MINGRPIYYGGNSGSIFLVKSSALPIDNSIVGNADRYNPVRLGTLHVHINVTQLPLFILINELSGRFSYYTIIIYSCLSCLRIFLILWISGDIRTGSPYTFFHNSITDLFSFIPISSRSRSEHNARLIPMRTNFLSSFITPPPICYSHVCQIFKKIPPSKNVMPST